MLDRWTDDLILYCFLQPLNLLGTVKKLIITIVEIHVRIQTQCLRNHRGLWNLAIKTPLTKKKI